MHGGKIVGSRQNRSKTDAYFTPAECTEAFINYGDIPSDGSLILEPACGDGAMSKILEKKFKVFSSDIVDFGYGMNINFLDDSQFIPYPNAFDGIITNPPYKDAEKFIKKSLILAPYVAMFLRLSFLEGKNRGKGIFKTHPPSRVLVCSKRPTLHPADIDRPRNGGFIAYAWYIWRRDRKITELDWIMRD